MENIRKNRQDQIRESAKEIKACTNIPSFEAGAKWADYHPYWREDLPKYEEDKNGLPKLYFCQVLTVDMTFGYRYSYRIGFITKDKNMWNIEQYGKLIKVTRWCEIHCDESENRMLEDIKIHEDSLVNKAVSQFKKED